MYICIRMYTYIYIYIYIHVIYIYIYMIIYASDALVAISSGAGVLPLPVFAAKSQGYEEVPFESGFHEVHHWTR